MRLNIHLALRCGRIPIAVKPHTLPEERKSCTSILELTFLKLCIPYRTCLALNMKRGGLYGLSRHLQPLAGEPHLPAAQLRAVAGGGQGPRVCRVPTRGSSRVEQSSCFVGGTSHARALYVSVFVCVCVSPTCFPKYWCRQWVTEFYTWNAQGSGRLWCTCIVSPDYVVWFAAQRYCHICIPLVFTAATLLPAL